MKKLIALILAVFVTLTVVGCSDENANSSANSESNQSNPTESLSNSNKQPLNNNESSNNSITTPTIDTAKCEIKVIDGQYYIFPAAKDILNNTDGSVIREGTSFKSVNEFVSALKKGEFPSGELPAINRFEKDELGRIKICNPDKIYEPLSPKEFSPGVVFWSGESYSFPLNGPHYAIIYVNKNEIYQRNFKEQWENFYGLGKIEKTESKDNCTETYFSTSVGKFKAKKYKLQKDVSTYEKSSQKAEVFVIELYRLESNKSHHTTSSTVPIEVRMFVQNDDLKYEVYLTDLTKATTPDYLMQFGLKPVGQ